MSISVTQKSNKIVINFSDTGIGISKNDVKFIFNKFYRTSRATKTDTEGMGIGLFLSREIVKRHGGSIAVASEGEGKGTSFTITLPVTPAVAAPKLDETH